MSDTDWCQERESAAEAQEPDWWLEIVREHPELAQERESAAEAQEPDWWLEIVREHPELAVE